MVKIVGLFVKLESRGGEGSKSSELVGMAVSNVGKCMVGKPCGLVVLIVWIVGGPDIVARDGAMISLYGVGAGVAAACDGKLIAGVDGANVGK